MQAQILNKHKNYFTTGELRHFLEALYRDHRDKLQTVGSDFFDSKSAQVSACSGALKLKLE